MSNNDPRIEILESRLALVEAQRDDANGRLKESWSWPNRLMAVVAFLAAISFISQFMVSLDLWGRSKDLAGELSSAKELISKSSEALEEYRMKLDKQLETSKVENKRLVQGQLATTKTEFTAQLEQVEKAQQCLALVSMGSEQVFFKRNPARALLFASAATEIYESGLKSTSSAQSAVQFLITNDQEGTEENPPTTEKVVVLKAIYPAIWNLQMECYLQQLRFEELREFADVVIAPQTHTCLKDSKYCSLRPAFFYRALTKIPKICSFYGDINALAIDDQEMQRFEELVDGALEDLESGTGGQIDQSLGTIYKALLKSSQGKYAEARMIFEKVRQLVGSSSLRPTSEQQVADRLSEVGLTMLAFLLSTDQSLSNIDCNLNATAITPWDGYLLERIVGKIITDRDWHLSNVVHGANAKEIPATEFVEITNRFGRFCVEWILAIRLACIENGDCPGGRCGQMMNLHPLDRDELYADFGLAASNGYVKYSRDRNLGKNLEGFLWMKHIEMIAFNVREVIELENHTTREIEKTEYRPEEMFRKFKIEGPIAPGAYVKIADNDVKQIYEHLDDPLFRSENSAHEVGAFMEDTAPSPPAPSPTPAPDAPSV